MVRHLLEDEELAAASRGVDEGLYLGVVLHLGKELAVCHRAIVVLVHRVKEPHDLVDREGRPELR